MKFSSFLKEAVNKKELLSDLKNTLVRAQPAGAGRITSGDIQQESDRLGIRYWGKWEIPKGEEDDGDYDWEVLSDASTKQLKSIIADFEKANNCKVLYQMSEKNWIDFSIK